MRSPRTPPLAGREHGAGRHRRPQRGLPVPAPPGRCARATSKLLEQAQEAYQRPGVLVRLTALRRRWAQAKVDDCSRRRRRLLLETGHRARGRRGDRCRARLLHGGTSRLTRRSTERRASLESVTGTGDSAARAGARSSSRTSSRGSASSRPARSSSRSSALSCCGSRRAWSDARHLAGVRRLDVQRSAPGRLGARRAPGLAADPDAGPVGHSRRDDGRHLRGRRRGEARDAPSKGALQAALPRTGRRQEAAWMPSPLPLSSASAFSEFSDAARHAAAGEDLGRVDPDDLADLPA